MMNLMINDPAPGPPTPTAYWPLDEHISGALAESLVAEHQHRIDPATIWHGPHTPLTGSIAARHEHRREISVA